MGITLNVTGVTPPGLLVVVLHGEPGPALAAEVAGGGLRVAGPRVEQGDRCRPGRAGSDAGQTL